MEQIKKIELKLAEWYSASPHLPVRGQRWLAVNAWWIDLVGIILSVIGILMILFVLLLTEGFLALAMTGGGIGTMRGDILFTAALINFVFWVVEIVLLAMAVGPLKNGLKRGWNYLFAVFLLSVLSALISFLLNLSAGGLVALFWNVVVLAIWGYFIFEVRQYFVGAKAAPRR